MAKQKRDLTSRLLILSSSFQFAYIFIIGVPDILNMVLEQWILGNVLCKVYLAMETIGSGLCINITGISTKVKAIEVIIFSYNRN